MAVTPLQTVPPAANPTEFDRLLCAWRYQQALWDVATYHPDVAGDLDEAESDRHCDATHEALLAFFAHPAADVRELAIKLNVICEVDAWSLSEAHKIMNQVASDAHELIPAKEWRNAR